MLLKSVASALIFAQVCEIESQKPNPNLVNEIRSVVLQQPSRFNIGATEEAFLEFLVHRELHLYVAETLATDRSLLLETKTLLLASLLKPPQTKYFYRRYDPKMVEVVLQSGVSPSDKYKLTTLWEYFLQLLDGRKVFPPLELPQKDLVEIAKSMIRHGADTDVHASNTSKGPEDSKDQSSPDFTTPIPFSIISRSLGAESARDILGREPNRKERLHIIWNETHTSSIQPPTTSSQPQLASSQPQSISSQPLTSSPRLPTTSSQPRGSEKRSRRLFDLFKSSR